MKKTIFTGAGVAIVTPMHDDMSINYNALRELINLQIADGTDAIVICGTTGESATLTHEEHTRCIQYAVEYAKGRVPVVAGAGSNDTAYAVELSKEAEKAGADALLHVSPYYNKTSQQGLIRHFTAIADATALPVMLYNIPSRTGVNILPETFKALSAHPNIVAVKEAGGNFTQIARTIALCGDDLAVYSGNDDHILPILALGGKGVVSVLSNVLPKATHDICRLFFEGNLEESRALFLRYIPLMNALFSDVNPIPVKEALNIMGHKCGPCRLPLAPLSPEAREGLVAALREAELVS